MALKRVRRRAKSGGPYSSRRRPTGNARRIGVGRCGRKRSTSDSTSASMGWSKPWPRGRIAATAARRMRTVPRDGIAGPLRERHRRCNGLRCPWCGGYKRGMASVAERLRALLNADRPEAGAVAEVLDGGSHADRMEAITSLGGTALQAKLWHVAAGAPTVTQADLVP